MDTAQDQFLRMFTVVVVAGTVALCGMGVIALHSFKHFHRVPRPAPMACEPAPLLAVNTVPDVPSAPPLPAPTPVRRRQRTRTPVQTTKPVTVGLALEECQRDSDPLCGVKLGKEH